MIKLDLPLLPKCSSDLKYGPCPPARDLGSRVSGLVYWAVAPEGPMTHDSTFLCFSVPPIDPKSCLSDPKSGLADPKSGISDSKLGLVDPKSGLSNPKLGLVDPRSGLSDP